MGLINDPDTVAADKPDQYGLMLDRMKEGTLTWDAETFGYSSGVIGLQLFVNKKFDPQKWSLAKYLDNPASVEPPYNVGMACALCAALSTFLVTAPIIWGPRSPSCAMTC
jgi:hypothetical protein